MTTALVLGAGGFIGSHMVKRLKTEGAHVTAIDLKKPEFSESPADIFLCLDLREKHLVNNVLSTDFDEVYQFAADMGGAGYVFTGENDFSILHNSAIINLNVLQHMQKISGRIFYSSSACVYKENPLDPKTPEVSAYPAMPDSNYGWEKLFSEHLYHAYARNFSREVRIARLHNVFGPEGTYVNGKEKAPAAICRKVASARDGDEISLWGSGLQVRSFLYIDECIEGVLKLMRGHFEGPVNIGSERAISIANLAHAVIAISGKKLTTRYTDGPIGVMGRNSDNTLIKEKLGWAPPGMLYDGLKLTYDWINKQVNG